MDNFEMCWAKHPKYTHTRCRLKRGHKGVHVEHLPHKTIKWENTEAKPDERSEGAHHRLLSDVDSLKDQIDTIRIKLFAHKKQAFLNNELSIEDDEITYLASAIGKLLGASENLRDYIEGIRKQKL